MTTEIPDFDALYRSDPDPWSVRSSAYEQRKLGIVLACLSQARYANAWDPSCGVGALAGGLAARADRVLATDASVEAVALTRAHCADMANVDVGRLALPAAPDRSGFDLVVLAEFWYYLDAGARAQTLAMIEDRVAAAAEVVSLHWRAKPHDGWFSGEDAEREIATDLGRRGWTRTTQLVDQEFSLAIHRRDRT